MNDVARDKQDVNRSRIRIAFVTLGALVVVLSLVVAWVQFDRQYGPMRRAVSAIERLGGSVYFGRNRGPTSHPSSISFADHELSEQQCQELPQYLHELPKLRGLTLEGRCITDDWLSNLRDLTLLDGLTLFGTSVTGSGLSNLRHAPQLRVLKIYSSTLTDEGLEGLSDLVSVESLDLVQTSVSGRGLVHLERLSKLGTLNLEASKIVDEELAAITKLTQLEAIYLSSTSVSDHEAWLVLGSW